MKTSNCFSYLEQANETENLDLKIYPNITEKQIALMWIVLWTLLISLQNLNLFVQSEGKENSSHL